MKRRILTRSRPILRRQHAEIDYSFMRELIKREIRVLKKEIKALKVETAQIQTEGQQDIALAPQQVPNPEPTENAPLPLEPARIVVDPIQSATLQRDLRIMIVLDQFNIGGTETHALTLARHLQRHSVHVVVIGKNGPMTDSFLALGCPVYEMDFVNDRFETNIAEEDNIVANLKSILQEEDITLVHMHQIPSATFASRAAEEMRIPMVFTAHGAYYDNELSQILNRCAAVACVSPAVWKLIRKKSDIVPHVIPNGIDTIEFDYRSALHDHLRKKLGIHEDGPVVLYAGRITWEKATICEDVIRACRTLRESRYPKLQLLIVGTGKDHESVRNMIAQIQPDSDKSFIHLVGPSLHMCAYYSLSDCLIGTGRTAIEAMACQCPVIAVGVHGFFGRVTASNYDDAWACWFGDHHSKQGWSVELLTAEIDETLKRSSSQRDAEGWIGRKYVQEKFDIGIVVLRLLHLYSETLKSQMAFSKEG